MSKLKSVSQSVAASSGASLNSHSQVSSANRGEIFNDLFDKMHVETMARQSGSEAHQQNSQQNLGQKSKDAPAVKNKEKTDQDDATRSTESSSSDNDERVEKAEDDSDVESVDDTSSDSSIVAKQSVATAEETQASMEELINQINTAMSYLPTQHLQQQNQQNDWQNVRVIMKDSSPKNISETIDSKLLRKIDVKTLNDQLQKLMQGQDVLKVSVPQIQAEQVAATTQDQSITMQSVMDLQENDLNVQAALLPEENGLDVETEEQQSTWAGVLKDMVPVAQNAQSFLTSQNSQNSQDLQNAQNASAQIQMPIIAPVSQDVAPVISQVAAASFSSGPNASSQPATAAMGTTSHQDSFVDLIEGTSTMSGQTTVSKTTTTGAGSVAGKFSPEEAAKVKTKTEAVIVSLSKNGKNESTRIQMHPEHLGKIEIKIEMKNKILRAEVLTDNTEARDAILQHVPQIKAALASENVKLDYFNARQDQNHFLSQNQAGELGGGASHRESHHGAMSENLRGDASAEEVARLQGVIRKTVESNSLINITV